MAENWRFSASQNGWAINQHDLEWLHQYFDPDTRAKANEESRLLILDGHRSHVTDSFVIHYMDHRITLMRLPPHTSHILQPLDVGLFGPLKTALSKHQNNLFQLQVAWIRKIKRLIAHVKACQTVFHSDNVFGD